MATEESLTYDKARDIVDGFCSSEHHLANHAIAFMVKGVSQKWKQPVGYFLSSGPMGGTEMKGHWLKCLDKLQDIGLDVKRVVCDQGSNNRNLYQKQLGVPVDKPYFTHNGKKVYIMYDPPHLLKNI